MAEKLPTTPDGIICKVCGVDKDPYHFFKHSGKYTQDFFTTELGYTNGVCFSCAGPYRCITCQQIKPASEFRVQGRVCNSCKSQPANGAGMAQQAALPALKSDFDAQKVSVVLDGENGAKTREWGES